VYKESIVRQFFPALCVDAEEFLSMYPEFIIPADQLDTFKKEKERMHRRQENYGPSTAGSSVISFRLRGIFTPAIGSS